VEWRPSRRAFEGQAEPPESAFTALLDDDSFVDLDALASTAARTFGWKTTTTRRTRGDRYCTIDGRDCASRAMTRRCSAQPGQGLRLRNRQDPGAGHQDGPPLDRHQRRFRRAHPGGCRLAWPVQAQYLPQQILASGVLSRRSSLIMGGPRRWARVLSPARPTS